MDDREDRTKAGRSEERDEILQALREQEAFFAERQRLALDTLVAGVAHEFNNLLTGAGGYAELALDNLDDPNLLQQALKTCMRAIRNGQEIVGRLETFAGYTETEWEVGDPSRVIRDVLDLCRHHYEHQDVLLEADLREMPPVRYDDALLALTVLDLLQNAYETVIHTQPERRAIRVCTGREGENAVVTIRDYGPGMDTAGMLRAAEPFYTTRGARVAGPQRNAKGLGLPSASGAARTLGGSIELRPAPEGPGLEARLLLPAALLAAQTEPPLVLVVDDEVSSRRILKTLLERSGFRVETLESAAPVTERLRKGGVDLILLDQVMPDMKGTDLLRQLPADAPPTVLVTAHYAPALARQALELGAVACTAKPIRREKISYLVHLHTGTPSPDLRALPAPSRRAPESERVLVVEPNAMMRQVLDLVLKRSGFDVKLVTSGADAEDATSVEYFNLILMNLMLHDRNGISTIETLRRNNPYTPILLTTPRLSRSSLLQALRAGATQALRQPLEIDALLQEVERLLEIFREDAPRATEAE